jgi:hypothetical protein
MTDVELKDHLFHISEKLFDMSQKFREIDWDGHSKELLSMSTMLHIYECQVDTKIKEMK